MSEGPAEDSPREIIPGGVFKRSESRGFSSRRPHRFVSGSGKSGLKSQ